MSSSVLKRRTRGLSRAFAACALLLVVGAGVRAQEGPRSTFDAGVAAFAAERYPEAAACFARDGQEQGPSKALLQNLALCYQQVGDPGRAIAALEQARRLAPRDRALALQLEELRRENALAAPLGWKRHLRWITLDEAALAGLAALITAGGLLLFLGTRWRRGTGPRARRAILLGSLASLLVVGAATASIVHQLPDLERAVIHDADTLLQLSPVAAAQSIGSAPLGTIVTLEQVHRDYVRVRTPEGRSGWIPRAAVTPLFGAPPSPAPESGLGSGGVSTKLAI